MEIAIEKKRIEKITVGADHRLARDKWLNIKRIVDAIYKFLSPLSDDKQTISLDSNNLSSEQRRMLPYVMEDLLKNKIASYYEGNETSVMSSDHYRRFLNGKHIIIENRNQFEDYRKKISELYDFIEKDGKKRFPEEYPLDAMQQNISDDLLDKIKNNAKEGKPGKKRPGGPMLMSGIGPVSRRGDNVKPAIGVISLAQIIGRIINDMNDNKGSIFGIFGKWGRGKTYLISKILDQEVIKNRFHVINFHAWKYQDTPASWAYLYEELTKNYYNTENFVIKNDVLRYLFQKPLIVSLKIWRNLKINKSKHGILYILFIVVILIIDGLLIFTPLPYKLDLLTKIIGVLGIDLIIIMIKLYYFWYRHKKSASQLIEKYTSKKDFIKYLGLQHEIQEEIKMLLKVWLNNKKRILLVIDDLDRCPEDRIIQIVDSLRIMLEDNEIYNKIVVLIAVDERILKRAIKYKYIKFINNNLPQDHQENDFSIDNLTREYMDKLFLGSIRLGNLTDREKEEIVNNFVINIKVTENRINQINTGETIDFENKRIHRNGLIKQTLSEKIVEIDNDELDDEEKTFILNSIKIIKNITPRQIDIFRFRYLLARNIMWSIEGSSYDPEILCDLLATYTNDFNKFGKDIIKKEGEKNFTEKILEMVVTY
jgi:hypothetical protein